jgi:hypothetical protein
MLVNVVFAMLYNLSARQNRISKTFEQKGQSSKFRGSTFEQKGATSEFRGSTSE